MLCVRASARTSVHSQNVNASARRRNTDATSVHGAASLERVDQVFVLYVSIIIAHTQAIRYGLVWNATRTGDSRPNRYYC